MPSQTSRAKNNENKKGESKIQKNSNKKMKNKGEVRKESEDKEVIKLEDTRGIKG